MELYIGKIAKRFGITVNAIRHYEERGLIGPLRRKESGYASNGYRIFTEKDIARLEFIRQARLLDLSLEQIKELLESADDGCCSAVRPNLKELLEAKIRETKEKIEGMRRFSRRLKRWHQEVARRVLVYETASPCPPRASPSECIFGNTRKRTAKEGGKGTWQKTG